MCIVRFSVKNYTFHKTTYFIIALFVFKINNFLICRCETCECWARGVCHFETGTIIVTWYIVELLMSYCVVYFILVCGNVVNDKNTGIKTEGSLVRVTKLVSSQGRKLHAQSFDRLANNKHKINAGFTA